MRSTTSGLLLLLLGVVVLSGFLTGNLDRWMGYLFDPTRPALAATGGAVMTQGGRAPVSALTTAGERRGGV